MADEYAKIEIHNWMEQQSKNTLEYFILHFFKYNNLVLRKSEKNSFRA